MNSLRRQLLLSLSVGLIVVLGVAGAFLYLYLRHVLVSSFDGDLLDKARVFTKTTEMHGEDELEFEFIESGIPEYTRSDGTQYFQVWDLNGVTITRSPSLGDRDLPAHKVTDEAPYALDIVLPNGKPGRVIYLKFVPRLAEESSPVPEHERPTLVAALAVPTVNLLASLSRVFNGLLLTAVALVLAVAPTVWWSLRRGLRSLDVIGEQANAIDTNTLPQGFSSNGLPQELLPIAGRLNDLLHRLHISFTRERRFTADAAHELRTPIAELRTLAEVGIAESSNTHPGLDAYFQDVLAIAQHLERLVTTLLALARCESGLQKVSIQTFSVSQLIETTLNSLNKRTARNDVRINVNLPKHAEVHSDPDLLKTIFINVFSNAVAYVSENGHIDVAVVRRDRSWVIGVSNTTRGLKAEDLGDIFKPFWRKEQNQNSESHYGLGLSLVAAYSSLLGLLVRAEMVDVEVFRIEIVCPANR